MINYEKLDNLIQNKNKQETKRDSIKQLQDDLLKKSRITIKEI